MSDLKTVLNDLLNISENFSSTPMFADFNWYGAQKIYKTKLSQLATNLECGLTPISNSKRTNILQKWNDYITKKQELVFSIKELEVLSFEEDIIKYSEYWNLLMNIETVTSKMIIGLVYSIHKAWTSIENLDSILHIIQQFIKDVQNPNKIILVWEKNINQILSIDAPNQLAEIILSYNISISDIEKKYFINLKNTEFGILLHKNIIEKQIIHYMQSKTITLNKVKKLINEINNVIIEKHQKNEFWGYLIKAINNTTKEKNDSKEFIKDFFIHNIDYKDPRYFPEKWLNFEENAKNIFISWLNEQDIRVFFELFIDNDPHGRKKFWLQYVNNIRRTKIIQNTSLPQNEKHRDEIKDLKLKGVELANIYDLKSNVFIMEFDKFIVVEFTEVNNACYIYPKDKIKILDTFKNTYSKTEVKNKHNTIKLKNHTLGWKYDLSNWLANYGVRP